MLNTFFSTAPIWPWNVPEFAALSYSNWFIWSRKPLYWIVLSSSEQPFIENFLYQIIYGNCFV